LASFSKGPSPSVTTIEPVGIGNPTTHPPQPSALHESWMKRCVVHCARTLHDLPFTFPLMVKTFRMLQSVGVNITPNHYYWPVPDIAELEKREWTIFSFPPDCSFDLKTQIELARELRSTYGEECRFSQDMRNDEYHYNNGYFEAVDAEVAYGIVRHYKPNRIIEIGTGYSTRVLAAALQKNFERDNLDGKLISVDPYPERFVENRWSQRVVQKPMVIQDLDLEFFDTLESGDILFIDSSHVVSVGSDVVREYLQILPRLKPGVLVHVHDIFLPSDYPRKAVLENLWFWSEQYLLQAFLSFNSKFEVLWGSSAMQLQCPWILDECFPAWEHSYRRMPKGKRRFVPTVDGDRVWPSSFWMRRV
jgi:predicted O-methyltransferase YrrM